MKILLVSDTHRRLERLEELMGRLGKIDAIFHMGDSEQNPKIIEEMAGCPLYIVAGNCDYNSHLPGQLMVSLGGHNFFITHGHRYGVDFSLENLKQEALRQGADVACFGHTHRPVIEYGEEITVVNPGSLTQPRPYGSDPSYIIMEIDDNNDVHFSLNYY